MLGRKMIKINVKQHISYSDTRQEETWNLEADASLVTLRTYSKLIYCDQDGVSIEVKWYPKTEKEQRRVDIIQPGYQLHFQEGLVTRTHYQTPQGIWELEVHTDSLDIQEEDGPMSLDIQYRIRLNQEFIGKYNFQLHYVV